MTVDINNIEFTILNVIKEYSPAQEDVGLNSNLSKDCLIDSYALLQIIDKFERIFKIEIKDSEISLQNFSTVSAVINFLRTKLEK